MEFWQHGRGDQPYDSGAAEGLAAEFRGGDPEGGGFAFLMGSDAAGGWGFWQGSQQGFAALLVLPGQVRACGAGQDVSVLQEPNAAAKQSAALVDGTVASAAEFLLTLQGSLLGRRGEGYYRLTGATAGWVNAQDVTAAGLGDCALHDELEGRASRG